MPLIDGFKLIFKNFIYVFPAYKYKYIHICFVCVKFIFCFQNLNSCVFLFTIHYCTVQMCNIRYPKMHKVPGSKFSIQVVSMLFLRFWIMFLYIYR